MEEAALAGEPAEVRVSYSRLLSRVRDEVMAVDQRGEVYIRLVYHYAPEVMALLWQDGTLRADVKAPTLEVQPLLEALVDGKAQGRLPADWVRRVAAVLEQLAQAATPELQSEIEWWQKRVPQWVGKTPAEVWAALLQEPRASLAFPGRR